MFVPLSKITFSAYLLHPILLQLYYFSRPSAFHFTHSFQLLHMFFAAVATSYGCALLLSLAIEVPVVNFDKLIFGPGSGGAASRQRRSAEQSQQKEQQQNGTEIGMAPAQQAQEMQPLMTKKGEELEEKEEKEEDGGQTIKQIGEENAAEK
ncbi:hypothetical protein niasHS_011229 [Heterodera schachtii]|uniref:Uncharacterized protein n=1 Tax=Heterodera schachtii TaxID=97005 RepID=A0ABD2IWB3_HETSC